VTVGYHPRCDQAFDEGIVLLRDGGAAQARKLEGRHEAARQGGSVEESQRLFAAALAAALPVLGPLHRLRHASADGVLLNGGSETRGGAAATSMMAAAKQLLAFHQARDDLCAPARTELPTAAVAPLLQLGKAAQLLEGFEPEGRAASAAGGGDPAAVPLRRVRPGAGAPRPRRRRGAPQALDVLNVILTPTSVFHW
jgi:hypothetical protein